VGIRAGLDAVAKRIYHCPCRETNPDRLARSLVTILTELSRLTVIDGRELKITEYGLIYSSMIFIPSFTKIHHLVQKLLGMDRQGLTADIVMSQAVFSYKVREASCPYVKTWAF